MNPEKYIPVGLVVLAGLLVFSVPSDLFAQQIVINEVMASNSITLADEDGDYGDWIELFNSGDAAVNLTDFSLSDDPDDLTRWRFPGMTIAAGEHLVIFASGKDRKKSYSWDTVVDWGDNWQYRLGDSEPPSDWIANDFDFTGWKTGPSGFGYGDGDDATTLSSTTSVYIRKSFEIREPGNLDSVILHIDYDDGFVAYLNGVEIARANVGTEGVPVPYNQGADAPREAEMYGGGAPAAFPIADIASHLKSGTNVLAIQGQNVSASSSDMSLIPFLSLGYAVPPSHETSLSEHLSMESGNPHTNFKINAGGEPLYLVSPEGAIVDEFSPDSLPADVSKGRYPDGTDAWLYYPTPSPGTSNQDDGISGISDAPIFSKPGGHYDAPVSLVLSSNGSGGQIYYTTDGAVPDPESSEYSAPITIDATTVIRARMYESGKLPGKVVTHTYLLDVSSTLSIISIATAPENLWDNDNGIYVLGDEYEKRQPWLGANFWEDWEKSAHVELYEPDGSLGFTAGAGVKIHGGWSRERAQKSLSIFFRGEYGTSELEYSLFPDLDIETYSSFILRSSANDWEYTMFRDALMQRLVCDQDIDGQAYRPSVVYLNGEYWGIHNIREKLNEDYLASHYNVDPDEVDILEANGMVVEGSSDHYNAMLDYISANGVRGSADYAHIRSQMDISNYIDYQISEIYFDNRDWPGNNIKFWRPQKSSGKWRWLLYDTDFGFGLYNGWGQNNSRDNYEFNTLAFATDPDVKEDWPNPPWSTFLLRSLLENTEFKIQFINRFADLLNTVFQPDAVLNQINLMQNGIQAEIPRHYNQWKDSPWWTPYGSRIYWGSSDEWYENVAVLRVFARHRATYVRSHISQKFGLAGTLFINADVGAPESGQVRINSVTCSTYPWRGLYFKSVPVKITAVPKAGYRFLEWANHPEWTSETVVVRPEANMDITAVFTAETTDEDVIINEINYNSSDGHNTEDWIELYNQGEVAINLAGWNFTDEEDIHQFILPENTIISGNGYLVLCEDSVAFRAHNPETSPVIGEFDFGLSGGGELIRLFNASGTLIDSLTYDDKLPWPPDADGNGPTLELINPSLDNGLPDSWRSSNEYGTPGARNSAYQPVKIEQNRTMPGTFALRQNYPNPFNNTTTIPYDIPSDSQIRLAVYNIRGEVVEILDQGIRDAGRYTARWDASAESSGLYFIHLESPDNTQVVKCLLLK
ncbi:MAG: CotH kinase family protein [Candidatus Marinimicrobia bacterium]|nr:CotH kinase family protein [Candidatus Neomarinimicrobiota bacterium]MCF7829570.1 CotH kinase family protein [Candidatus Neomarinimicrobiota bacterium]MCF7882020.1 CotH kinase family protein [Candidatus Neomarinimicrobiota bacterium]